MRKTLTRQFSREIEVSQSDSYILTSFDEFSYELLIYFLSLPPIIENHFLLVHLSRCRQAQLLLNPHCCNWAWGFPETKYKQKGKISSWLKAAMVIEESESKCLVIFHFFWKNLIQKRGGKIKLSNTRN